MIMRVVFLILSLCCYLHPLLAKATPHYGATGSYVAYSTEPPSLTGYQLMLNYDPEYFQWRKFNIFFDGGFSHFSANTPYYTTLNIYSIAPIIRYKFKQRGPFHPYLDLSIGIAYLNHTRIGCRNLGIHFGFQDRAGVGVLFGQAEKLSVGIHAVHYSNAGLSEHNSGMTIPLSLDVGYRFD